MHLIFDSHDSIINRLSDFAVNIFFNGLILTCTIFTDCGSSKVTRKTVSWRSSWPEFCVIWPWKRPASGRGSFWESSSFVPWLVFNACRDGSGVVPECPGSSGFIRKSSSRASAPRMRFYVLLNSFDSLFVTLPSTSAET